MHLRYRSISYKLSAGLSLTTIIPLLVFCIFFYTYMSNSYRKNYINQANSSMSVSIENINHYVYTCVTSAQSIYYNNEVQNLLLYGDPLDFTTIESARSSQILSYMLSVYAATPDAVQIRLAAFRMKKSFLVTTKNLQRYINTADFSNENLQNFKYPNQIDVQSVHKMNSYGHSTNYDIQLGSVKPLYVFTIKLPIYNLPSTKDIMGMLYIDIPISFIERNCENISPKGEANYVVDKDNTIIFSSDSDQVGRKVPAGSTLDLFNSTSAGESGITTKNTDKLLVLSKNFDSNYFQWIMAKTIPTKVIYEDVRIQLVMLLFSFAICLIAAVLFNSISILRYTVPLKKATDYMKNVNNNANGELNINLSKYVSYKRNDEIGVLLTTLENMLNSINDFTIRQYKLDIANITTELKMLQTQINPHFIYNTLQCLATNSLKRNDKEQYSYISSLGQMMQYSMETNNPLVQLKDEITYVERYVQLQKMRFTNNLNIVCDISPDTEDITVPKMILQPLIENSFKHGNLFQSETGKIVIRSLIRDNLLYIYIIDNGIPISKEKRRNLMKRFNLLRSKYNVNISYHNFNQYIKNTSSTTASDFRNEIKKRKEQMYSSNNIGLTNVFLRLLLNFGSSSKIDIYANDSCGTTVQLAIPYKSLWTPQINTNEGDNGI